MRIHHTDWEKVRTAEHRREASCTKRREVDESEVEEWGTAMTSITMNESSLSMLETCHSK